MGTDPKLFFSSNIHTCTANNTEYHSIKQRFKKRSYNGSSIISDFLILLYYTRKIIHFFIHLSQLQQDNSSRPLQPHKLLSHNSSESVQMINTSYTSNNNFRKPWFGQWPGWLVVPSLPLWRIVNPPQGDLAVSASKGFAISRGESGREGGPLTQECGSSIGLGGSILPSIQLCPPVARDFAPPVTNIPGYACRSRFLRGSFSSPLLPPADLQLRLPQWWRSRFIVASHSMPSATPSSIVLVKKFGSDCRGIPAGFEASDSGANLNCNQGWGVYILYWTYFLLEQEDLDCNCNV